MHLKIGVSCEHCASFTEVFMSLIGFMIQQKSHNFLLSFCALWYVSWLTEWFIHSLTHDIAVHVDHILICVSVYVEITHTMSGKNELHFALFFFFSVFICLR